MSASLRRNVYCRNRQIVLYRICLVADAQLAAADRPPARARPSTRRMDLMNSSGPLRSSLSRHAASSALEAEALRERARAAWHKSGAGEDCWLCVRLGDVPAW